MMKVLRIKIGSIIRKIGLTIMPEYWKCNYCGLIEFERKEVLCMKCTRGEMIYKGK